MQKKIANQKRPRGVSWFPSSSGRGSNCSSRLYVGTALKKPLPGRLACSASGLGGFLRPSAKADRSYLPTRLPAGRQGETTLADCVLDRSGTDLGQRARKNYSRYHSLIFGMSQTYNPSRRKRKTTHGFLVRSRTKGGKRILRNRRRKGRAKLSV